jgi:hypothetical protein
MVNYLVYALNYEFFLNSDLPKKFIIYVIIYIYNFKDVVKLRVMLDSIKLDNLLFFIGNMNFLIQSLHKLYQFY